MIEVMPTLSSLSAPQETQSHSPSVEPSSDLSIKQNAPSDEPLEFSDEIPEILEQDVVSPTAIRREPPANEPLLLTKPETLETTAEKTFGDTNTSGEEIALRIRCSVRKYSANP